MKEEKEKNNIVLKNKTEDSSINSKSVNKSIKNNNLVKERILNIEKRIKENQRNKIKVNISNKKSKKESNTFKGIENKKIYKNFPSLAYSTTPSLNHDLSKSNKIKSNMKICSINNKKIEILPSNIKSAPDKLSYSQSKNTSSNKKEDVEEFKYSPAEDIQIHQPQNSSIQPPSKFVFCSFQNFSECDDLLSGDDIPEEIRKNMLISRENIISNERSNKNKKSNFPKKNINALNSSIERKNKTDTNKRMKYNFKGSTKEKVKHHLENNEDQNKLIKEIDKIYLPNKIERRSLKVRNVLFSSKNQNLFQSNISQKEKVPKKRMMTPRPSVITEQKNNIIIHRKNNSSLINPSNQLKGLQIIKEQNSTVK